jgi:hypothetical protein
VYRSTIFNVVFLRSPYGRMRYGPFQIGKMRLSVNVTDVTKNRDAAASLRPGDLAIAGEFKQSSTQSITNPV